MRFPVSDLELSKLSYSDLIKQAGIMTWLIANECLARNGEFTTSPLPDMSFSDYVVDINAEDISPNKPGTIRVILTLEV